MVEYPTYKKVLFCTDFSKNADCAFDYAFGIAKRDEAVLYILHVIPKNHQQDTYLRTYTTEAQWNKIQEDTQENLDRLYNDRYLSQIKDKSRVKIVTKSGLEYDEILKFAIKEEVDLITIGTHGITGLEHVFFGSVAEKIVRYSPIPVFIIPCKGNSGRALFR
jgi:nucleotide-binding universal stress UspA family protein